MALGYGGGPGGGSTPYINFWNGDEIVSAELYTVCFWWRRTTAASGDGTLFRTQGDSAANPREVLVHHGNAWGNTDGNICVQVWNGTYIAASSGSACTLNQWYHVALTVDGANGAELFLDGVSDVTDSTSVVGIGNVAYGWVGERGNYATDTQESEIEAVKWWDRVLTADEIRAEMQQNAPVSWEGLLRWMPVLDGAGGGGNFGEEIHGGEHTWNNAAGVDGNSTDSSPGIPMHRDTILVEEERAASGTTGTAAMTFGVLEQSASGTVTTPTAGTAAMTFGALEQASSGTAAHHGTAAMTFGALAQASSGTAAHHGTAAMTFGALEQVSSGTVQLAISGTAAMTFGALEQASTGDVAATGSAAMTFGAFTQAATGIASTAITGTAAMSFGALDMSAVGAGEGVSRGAFTFPQFGVAARGGVNLAFVTAKNTAQATGKNRNRRSIDNQDS